MQIINKHKKFFHEIVSVVLVLAVIAGTFSLSFKPKSAWAATYTFTQSSWSGGATANIASHPNSSSTWTEYSSASGILGAGNLTVSASSYSFTDDGATSTDSPIATGGGFLNGINASTTINGTGTGASVELATTSDRRANLWTTFDPTDAPGTIYGGGSLVYPGSGDYIYAFRGNSISTFWAYSLTNNNWTTFDPTDAPASVGNGGSLVYPGSGNYIYAFRGDTPANYSFWAIDLIYPKYSSGTFESATIDFGGPTAFNTLTFSATTTNSQTSCTTGAGCAVKIQAAANNDNSTWNYVGPDGTANTYFTQQAGETISSSLNNNRYFRYKAYLATTNTTYTPFLNFVTINNTQYPTTGTKELISSKYNTGSDANLVDKIDWIETSTSTTETVKLQIRTASSSAGLDSATWCGDDNTCDNNNYFSAPSSTKAVSVAVGHPIKSGGDDQWLQYRVILASGGGVTPVVDDVIVTYVVNAPPDFDSAYSESNMNCSGGTCIAQIATTTDADWGKVLIKHRARDADTNNGATPLSASTTFEYRLNSSASWTSVSLLTPSRVNRAIAESYISTSTVWDAKSQIGQVYSTTTQIKVTLYDGEAANHTASTTSAQFTLDTKNPAASITIDSSGVSDSVAFNFSDDSNIEYRLSNSSLTNETYTAVNASSTTASTTWTLSGSSSGETVYFEVRDIYGNAVSSSDTAPAIPTNFYYKDISNPDTADYREFLSWGLYSATSSAAFGSYQIYRSTDGTNYNLLTTIANSATNYYTDTSVSSSTTYYYKVRFADSDGDISNFSSSVFDQPNGQGGSDTTAPVISNASSSEVQATWARITWTTDEISTSTVEYSTASANDYASSTAVVSYVTNHSVVINNLTPNTQYKYRVKSADINNNTATDSNSGAGYAFTTLGGPIISSVSCSSASDNSITIVWNTDRATGESAINYSVSSNLASPSTASVSGNSTSTGGFYQHTATLSNLSQSTKYYFKVASTDTSANSNAEDNGGNYYSCSTTKDTKPPAISSISTPVITSSAAVIMWQTDEPSTSQVEYGLTSAASGSYTTSTIRDNTLTKIHVVTITGLTAETKYYYRVQSYDMNPDSATAVSSEQDVTTTATKDTIIVYVTSGGGGGETTDTTSPTISNIEISDIGSFGATVDFSVSEDATAFVNFGETENYGFNSGSSDFKSSHKVKLRGLKMGAGYNFKIKAIDKAGNYSYSENQKFSTKYFAESVKDLVTLENASNFQEAIEDAIESVLPSIIPPFIEKPEVTDIMENSAIVKWKTNISAYSVVVYSSEKDYDILKANPYPSEVSNTDKKSTNHEINLIGLDPNTQYHYMAKSFSLPQAIGRSKDLTFTTKAAKIKPRIADVDNDAIRIVWVTDELASSIIEYKNLRTGEIDRKTKADKVVDHDIKIENLNPDTTYEIKVMGYNEKDNLIEAGDILTARTSRDVIAPTITNLKIDGALVPGRNDRVQTVVSWKTDEMGTSIVEYGESSGGADQELGNKIGESDVYVETHNVILTKLKPGTLYRLRVTSVDDAGNKTSSPIRTIITPRQSESIVDVIVKNFEDTFQFLQRIK